MANLCRAIALAFCATLVLTSCATSDAPFTRTERRQLAWKSALVKRNYREAVSRALNQNTAGTLLIIRNDAIINHQDTPVTMIAGDTPAKALRSIAPPDRRAAIADSSCVWVGRESVVSRPATLSCGHVAEEAELIESASALVERARGLALELDQFEQTSAKLADGLVNTFQLASVTDERVRKLDESVKIAADSSVKANDSLTGLISNTQRLVSIIKAANDDFSKQIADLSKRLDSIK